MFISQRIYPTIDLTEIKSRTIKTLTTYRKSNQVNRYDFSVKNGYFFLRVKHTIVGK